MKKLAVLFALLCVASVKAQTVSPILGLGTIQVLDNTGALANNAVLYFYAAGTTTQQATFTDSSGKPRTSTPFRLVRAHARRCGSRADSFTTSLDACRTTGRSVQHQMCFSLRTTCQEVLLAVEAAVVRLAVSGSSSHPLQARQPVVFSAARPVTPASLSEMPQGLGLTKDANDLLSWPTPLKFPEIAAPASLAGFDIIAADSTAHRFKMYNNGAAGVQIVASGNDISISDSVTAVHFGANQAPIGSTLPSTGQALTWNGSNIVGTTLFSEAVVTFNDNSSANCPSNGVVLSTLNACAVRWFWANAHTVTRFRIVLGTSAGCTTHPVYSVEDLTSSTIITSLTQVNGTTTYDSGAISLPTTAGHAFGIGMTTASVGCTTTPDFIQADMTYQ